MKILFSIAYFYPSQKGGPANSIYWLAKGLKTQGIQSIIVSTDVGVDKNAIPSDKWLETEAGKIIYKKEINYLFWPKFIWESLKQVSKCDVIHLTSLFAFPSIVVAIFSFIKKKKIIWSPRGELDKEALIYSTWKKKPILWLIKFYLAKTVFFHVTSREEKNRVQIIFGQDRKIISIPNFMDIPDEVERTSFLPEYLLYIGRIHAKKAVNNLIKALSLSVSFSKSNFSLIIAGDHQNSYGDQLQDLIKELKLESKVKFIGHIEKEEKQLLYANAHFTFLPSHTENFGNVVIESLAQGTPVVASLGTPWEMLEVYNAGYWVDNNESTLGSIIDKILSLAPEEYADMRKNARQLCESQFDINNNISIWVDSYNRVLHG